MQSVWTLLSWGPEGWLDDIADGVLVTVSLALATLPDRPADRLLRRPRQAVRRAVAAACRQHLHHDLSRPAGAGDAVPGLFRRARSACRTSCTSSTRTRRSRSTASSSGMIALGVVFSSYASEVFLSAFRAIPHGQYEGGYAIGLTNGQTMRLVVLPQLIRIALPGPRQSVADPAQGHRAGFGDRPGRHIAAGRRRGARHQARLPVLRRRRPDLSRAGHHLVLRHPRHRARVGSQEAHR